MKNVCLVGGRRNSNLDSLELKQAGGFDIVLYSLNLNLKLGYDYYSVRKDQLVIWQKEELRNMCPVVHGITSARD